MTNSNVLTVDLSVRKFEMGHLDVKEDEVPLPMHLDSPDFPYFLINYAGQVGSDHDVQTKVQKDSSLPNPVHTDRVISCNLDLCLGPPCSSTYPVWNEEILNRDNVLASKSEKASELCLEDGMHTFVRPLVVSNASCDSHLSDDLGWRQEDENKMCGTKKSTECTRTRENYHGHLEGHVVIDEAEINFPSWRSPVKISNFDDTSMKEDTQVPHLLPDQLFNQKQLAKTFGKLNGAQERFLSPEKNLMESAVSKNVFKSPQEQIQYNNVDNLSKSQKFKKSPNENMRTKENPLGPTTVSPTLEKTALPQFEPFIIEEEEGSGGYGIVYRARRKSDGKRIAIKCPHVNAHKHNVNNELKMLERFGGRNFIIKYEGSFNSGSSECFILEHVEHDRPEVLKKEIDLVQLQWYGYCLFRALAFLHKQGVMHRDVKPGNFLFSRKQNKGYLIDFNLAMDLHQKYFASKSNSTSHASMDHVPVPHSVSGSAIKDKKNFRGDFVSLSRGAPGRSKQILERDRNLKKRVCVGPSKKCPDTGVGNAVRSQGAEGSGITSAKDVTSARTHSTEIMREPIPCQGRKELINLLQSALLNTNHVNPNSSVLRRKRVAAPPGKADSKIVHPSPMLVHCSGVSIDGSRVLKNKGEAKRKREGSCAGTKGFRAPEVLFRSLHQGPQVDVWSAGVTLLYLMIGRSPFTGDPEQNIKDVAKLRGSEDLWEVAKLHDRESAFPGELFHIRSFPALDLQSWCKAHTRRPDFLRLIPLSLFDLVDKCLTVNPRLRISAEEALKHEFFKSCHESLRKQRMLRRGTASNSADIQSDAI